jgi:hypothetical protein
MLAAGVVMTLCCTVVTVVKTDPFIRISTYLDGWLAVQPIVSVRAPGAIRRTAGDEGGWSPEVLRQDDVPPASTEPVDFD